MQDISKIILCAEDDPDDKELFCDTATSVDPSITVIGVDNGRLLLKKLRELTSEGITPCLIILDMNMPVMDGRETLLEIKKNDRWGTIPVAIYTTSSRNLYNNLEAEYGVKIITKPALYSEIIETVMQLLAYCNK